MEFLPEVYFEDVMILANRAVMAFRGQNKLQINRSNFIRRAIITDGIRTAYVHARSYQINIGTIIQDKYYTSLVLSYEKCVQFSSIERFIEHYFTLDENYHRDAYVYKNPTIVTVDGGDGSFKQTTTEALVEKHNGVKLLSFPRYSEKYGAEVQKFLNSTDMPVETYTNKLMTGLLYSIDRADAKITEGKYVVDRYTTSNALYKTIGLSEVQSLEMVMDIYHIEFNLLHIPPSHVTNIMFSTPELVMESMKHRPTLDRYESKFYQESIIGRVRFLDSIMDINLIDVCKSDRTIKTTDEIIEEIILPW